MLNWFRRRSAADRTAAELYGRVVAAARQPKFYRDMGVADTPEGRFELIALHLFLALETMRLRKVDEEISRLTIETFVTDMDDCMREMAVGDMSVAKRVKRAAAAFYERAAGYRVGVEPPTPDVIREALIRWVYGGDRERDAAAARLTDYVMKTWQEVGTRELPGFFADAEPIDAPKSAGVA